MDLLSKVDKLGNGTYGEVYSARGSLQSSVSGLTIDTTLAEDSKELYAIKRNFTDSTATGIGSLRELDFLATLRGHPCIVSIIKVSFGDPFESSGSAMSPVAKGSHLDMVEDKVHFVLEYIPHDGYSFYRNKPVPPTELVRSIKSLWHTIKNAEQTPAVLEYRERMSAIMAEPSETHLFKDDAQPTAEFLEEKYSRINSRLATLRKSRIAFFYQIKVISCQLLLGIEFCHSKGILHRDMKPTNVLIVPGDNPQLKICDFGLSRRLCKATPSTPRAATSWYRAPEICTHDPTYSEPSDMWATGLTIFEFVSGQALLKGVKDNDDEIFNLIVARQESPDPKVIQLLKQRGARTMKPDKSSSTAKKLDQLLNLNKLEIAAFNSLGGSVEEFVDLIHGMLKLNPDSRLTATQALNHPFFNFLKPYIDDMREKYPPVPETGNVIKIVKCQERFWAAEVAMGIYNAEVVYQKSIALCKTVQEFHWYKHCILFHGFRLFDQYLNWAFDTARSNIVLKEVETATSGRIHSQKDTIFRFYCCIYIMHKFFSALNTPYEWFRIFPREFVNDDNKKAFEAFEELILRKIVKFRIFSPSLLETIDLFKHEPTSETIRILIRRYSQSFDYEGTIEDLYTSFCK